MKNEVTFLSLKQLRKKYPNHKLGRGPVSKPRPEWRNPVHFQIKYPNWFVCHGKSATYWQDLSGDRISGSASKLQARAWLELGKYVLDLAEVSDIEYFRDIVGNKNPKNYTNLVKKYRIPKATFYKKHGISGVKRYDRPSMAALVQSKAPYHSYGPYLDETIE